VFKNFQKKQQTLLGDIVGGIRNNPDMNKLLAKELLNIKTPEI
jgi:hypothetical protein